MADNANATSANPNARSANPNATAAASGSLVGHGKRQQQRCRNDKQQPLHANLHCVITENNCSKKEITNLIAAH
jgi:hypothetical protein